MKDEKNIVLDFAKKQVVCFLLNACRALALDIVLTSFNFEKLLIVHYF
jgi:hypothetical protein